jgi:hypothetical protein
MKKRSITFSKQDPVLCAYLVNCRKFPFSIFDNIKSHKITIEYNNSTDMIKCVTQGFLYYNKISIKASSIITKNVPKQDLYKYLISLNLTSEEFQYITEKIDLTQEKLFMVLSDC